MDAVTTTTNLTQWAGGRGVIIISLPVRSLARAHFGEPRLTGRVRALSDPITDFLIHRQDPQLKIIHHTRELV